MTTRISTTVTPMTIPYIHLPLLVPEPETGSVAIKTKPNAKLHSKLGAFISSWVKPDEFEFNTALNGSNRGIVPVAAYEEVMPLNIMSLQLLKSIVVKDIENAIKLGVLELAPEDLSLCSYVCPSKYDYCSILDENLELIYKELQ